jgi:WD40 repeat protein
VRSISYAPSRRFVAAGDVEGSLAVWKLYTGQVLRQSGLGRIYSVAFSRDGKFLVSASEDAMLTVWEADSLRQVVTYRDQPQTIFDASFAGDGNWILTSGADRTVRSYSCDLCGSLEDLIELARETLDD